MKLLNRVQLYLIKRPRLAMRVFKKLPESFWLKKGNNLKKEIYTDLIPRVSGYKSIIRASKKETGDQSFESAWNSLPVVDKKGYLSQHPLGDLILDNSFDNVSSWSQSSGYSGKPFYWPRSKGQDLLTAEIADIILTSSFSIDRVSTLAIVGLSLGNWITGELIASVLRTIAEKPSYPLSVITPGSDIDEILRNIVDLGSNYKQVLLFGYPPMIRRLIDEGMKQDINWHKCNLKVVVTGESYTEQWRKYIRQELGLPPSDLMSVMGFYGAADAGLIGIETPISNYIRRLLDSDKQLVERVFQRSIIPSLVQYNPATKYIELTNGGELVLSSRGALPLIKYNIHDEGGIIGFDEMIDCLSKYNIDILNTMQTQFGHHSHQLWKWPFCYIYGRSDGSVSIDGANVYPHVIEQTILNDEFAPMIESFRLKIIDDDTSIPKLAIYIQLSSDASKDIVAQELKKLEAHFQKIFVANLISTNSDYAKSYADHPSAVSPRVKLMSFGHGIFTDEHKKIKHRYLS